MVEHSKVRYAVVGLGHIAQEAVLPAFAHAKENSVLAGLVSDDPKKLKRLGRKHRVRSLWSYAEYGECLRSGEIDAVYIALPNTLHERFGVRAAKAGIHVICEKPLSTTAASCLRMIDAARDARVKLMTAYRLHFERANTQAIEIVRSGKLGEPRIFNALFTMQVEDRHDIRLRRATGGGTLWDIGIYCLNAARYVFRSEPIEALALSASDDDKRFREVEEMVSVVLRFPKERLATFTCSFGASKSSSYQVIGTRGDLRVDPAFHYSKGLHHRLTIDGRTRERDYPRRDQFAAELVYFSRCIRDDVEPEPSGVEGLADVRIVEALYRSAKKGGMPVSLVPIRKTKRPSAAQELYRPPVRKSK